MPELTILPERQQANTQILTGGGEVMDNYWRGAENLYRRKLFNYQQQQQKIKNAAAGIDFNTAGIMPSDENVIRKEMFDLVDKVNKNPDIVNPNNALYPEYKKAYEDIGFHINKSKQDNVFRGGYLEGIAKGTFDPEHRTELDQWASPTKTGQEISDRQPLNLTPKIDFNQVTFLNSLQPEFQYELSTGKPTGIGGMVQFDKTPTKESVERSIDNAWKSASDGSSLKQHWNLLYNDPDTPEIKQQYASAKDYYKDISVKQALSMKGQPEIRNIPGYGEGQGDINKPEFNWIIDNAMALSNLKSPIYAQDALNKAGKPIGKVTHAFDSLAIPIRGKDEAGNPRVGVIRGLYNINGKIYASTGATEAKTGYIDKDDLIEITNRYNQLITPYINQQYGSSPTTAKAIQQATNYAKEIDQKNILGLPSQTAVGGEKTQRTIVKTGTYNGKKVIQYSDGTVEYAE